MSDSKGSDKKLKLAFILEGSRGDVQPYVPLMQGLTRAGFVCKAFTQSDHAVFLKGFDIDSSGMPYSGKVQANTPEIKKAKISGDIQAFLKACEEILPYMRSSQVVQAYYSALDTFGPDLIIHGILTYDLAMPYCWTRLLPRCQANLQLSGVTSETTYVGAPEFPLGFLNRAVGNHVISSWMNGCVKSIDTFRDSIGLDAKIDAKKMMEAELENPMSLKLVGVDSTLCNAPADLQPPAKLTGYWMLDQKQQAEQIKQGDSNFGDTTALDGFIKAGDAPVYIGWGSMIAKSKKFMINLAVGAAKSSQKRAVILGGYAELSIDDVSDDLKAYCATHILLMKSAPHALLFPQCACVVHHGGAGTTAAGIQSNVPTVITPCFVDQFDNAKCVAAHNIGVATTQLHALGVEELSAAITKCCSNASIRQAAAAFQLAQDGVAVAVAHIQQFATLEKRNSYKQALEARVLKSMEPPEESSCTVA